jgi:hypothetical protein
MWGKILVYKHMPVECSSHMVCLKYNQSAGTLSAVNIYNVIFQFKYMYVCSGNAIVLGFQV